MTPAEYLLDFAADPRCQCVRASHFYRTPPNQLTCVCVLQKDSVFVIIAPPLDTCVQGCSAREGGGNGKLCAEGTRLDGWDVMHTVKVGGKILMHVLVPK